MRAGEVERREGRHKQPKNTATITPREGAGTAEEDRSGVGHTFWPGSSADEYLSVGVQSTATTPATWCRDEERTTEHHHTQALRQGNRAVAKATRYPEGGTSTNTGPGHHKGPTTGEGGNKRQGRGANNSQEKDKRKGAPPHQERHTRAKGKDTRRNAGKSTNTTKNTTNRSQAREEKRHKTKDKPTARKAWPKP